MGGKILIIYEKIRLRFAQIFIYENLQEHLYFSGTGVNQLSY